MKFEELDINKKLVEETKNAKFEELTPIQEKCIPAILEGKDVVGQAQTGSGKTIAFCLPIIQKIKPQQGIQAVILTPTRELCLQVSEVLTQFGRKLNVKTTSIYGGVSINPQIQDIRRSEIVVGTPGRMLDHLHRKTLNLGNIRFLVLDETDKMLDMGFIDDVERIISFTPKQRQTLMFSATTMRASQRLMNRHLSNPVVLKTKSLVDNSKLEQIYYDIYQKDNKFSILVHLIKNETHGLAIVFCSTRRATDMVARNLKNQNIKAAAIHGGLTQKQRTDTLERFREEKIHVLVATNVAARGIDVENITHIYHYDVPKNSTEYIHRIGRTARAGENGTAVTLLTRTDHDNFRKVQSDDKLDIKREDIPKFQKVPFISRLRRNRKSHKKKRFYKRK